MKFEWDGGKAERNFKKHKETFTEAATVFSYSLSITIFGPDHSITRTDKDEVRYGQAPGRGGCILSEKDSGGMEG
jgi:uncharacterized DUF497 family protein